MISNRLLPKLFFACFAFVLAGPLAAQPGHPEDAAFQSAREAFAKGERARLSRALAGLKTHPLLPWAEYFRLSLQLEDGSDSGMAAFIAAHEGGYLAEKARSDWLKWLIRKEDWSAARIQFARLQRPDAEAQCRGLEVRLRLGEPEALPEAHALMALSAPLAEPCLTSLGRLAASGELPDDLLWERLRRLLAQGKTREARIVAGWLPDREEPAWRTIESINEHPARYLAKLPAGFPDSRRGRGYAAHAVVRMARGDVSVAAARWRDIESRFPAAERGFVWGRLALVAAMNHHEDAGGWFDQAMAHGAALDEEQHAWRIRAALRAGRWPAVVRAVADLPASMTAQPEWVYWRARAHAAANEMETARSLFESIAGQPNFYGILATEALGRPYVLPPRAPATTPEELADASARAGLVRALALIRLDMRIEGLREWNWGLAGLSDRQVLAAAELARRHDIIDRSISAADRTQTEHDYGLRYPTPFLSQVEPRARAVELDTAWVYGLMRQESRFIMDAKSSAGAKGLMQLMPATAKWVAKKIGMQGFHPAKVTDMNTNVTLGTNYMRMVMESLDNHPVLASAAYNAGPGRARKWRAERALEGAIYAETIPFAETRDYVKKVMANTIHYAALLGNPGPSLTKRLGSIRPRGFNDGTAEDLP